MYFETRIDIPDVPGKITISRKIYVQYEIGRRYNPEKKYDQMAESLKQKTDYFFVIIQYSKR